MALSLNNNTWFYLGTFDIEKIPETDADKEKYVQENIEP